MTTGASTALKPYIERARKVLQHEQHTNHQDQAVKPGGLEAFVRRWLDEIGPVCHASGRDLRPFYRLASCLEGYRQQDPLQRAANLRAALALLNELESEDSAVPGRQPSSGPRSSAPPNEPLGQSPRSAPTIASATPARSSKPVEAGRGGREHQEAGLDRIALDSNSSPGHAALTLLTTDVSAIHGVGPTVATRLHSLGIRTVGDLLFYFPREHRDYSKLLSIAELPFDELVTTRGLIWEVKTSRTGSGRTRTVATLSDGTGRLSAVWFNQPYLQKQLSEARGEWLVVTGVKQRFGNKVTFTVRSHELPEKGELLNTGILVPIYSLTEGLPARTMRRLTRWVVDRYAALIPDHLPATIRQAAGLLPLSEAVAQMHYPATEEQLAAARRRLAFDELFLIQLGMQERRTRWQRELPSGQAFRVDLARVFAEPTAAEREAVQAAAATQELNLQASQNAPSPQPGSTLWAPLADQRPFEATLPFRFTAAQRRVLCEILGDLSRSQPMCRLLQGDVGSGKTAVAAAALFVAALNGYQGAIMAPTEILAEQHARSIGAMLAPFGIRTVLLTGGLRPRERALGRAAIESGEAAVAIGTHALIQEDVTFQRLGLVIIDEQHRFGVEQREALRQKGYHPHMLVMTATPIPRTLALTLYGDLDLSVIDQLPPGRQKVITRWRTGARREEAYRLIEQQLAEGRQAFIICPLVDESESLSARAVTAEYERLSREVFPHRRLGLLHGGMKPAEKDAVMRRFRDHELDILVATSVVEVGIDVPNATVMVIEDADRFGLSQLHQFRGRVGRGAHQSYCYVLSADASLQARERLAIFQETDDGFKLAEHDLRLRGPGDFIGVRQSGMPELRIADFNDTRLIEETRTLAARLWASDPYLRRPEHAPLREHLSRFWQAFIPH
ncbi:ATP-dependent DNA helicase RecG [Thermogemmatispora onikobensis]|uniref:ATP-dependent DNA helicase RecG n=1 Tax=Thermogemmatispora onikobensis TaxID=732234 RepID=UPI0008530ADD|nr:ATP-dependent DNA helicase RecG [Thermogemmatispora onikobensis]